MEREALLSKVFETARHNEKTYFGCTQAVLAALQETMGVGSQEVFKAGTPLAGGVAGRGETCGALTGALLAIGTLVGRERLEDREKQGAAMEPATKVYLGFQEAIGHTNCQEIHKILYGRAYRPWVPEERDALHADMAKYSKACPEVCGHAARIAAEVILAIRNAS